MLASSVLDETVEAKRVVVVAVAADLALVVFLLLVVVFPMVVVSPVVVVSLVEVLFLNQQRRSDNNNGQLFNDLLTASREFKTPAVGELVEGPPRREASLRRARIRAERHDLADFLAGSLPGRVETKNIHTVKLLMPSGQLGLYFGANRANFAFNWKITTTPKVDNNLCSLDAL